MHLKTFTADSLPEAMQQVREYLGEDAVILSTENDPDGAGVRVTAALEDGEAPESLFDGEESLEAFNLVNEALDYHRVPLALMDSLLSTVGKYSGLQPRDALAKAIDAELSFAPLPRQATGYPLMLIGPPGAGKTATAAKLAAQVRVRGGKATLVTLDTGKAGSLAQITAFAEALGANLREAHDAASLKRAVGNCPNDHFVVIDTIGSGPYDRDCLAETSEWLRVSEAEGVLIMPAGGDSVETAEAALSYASLGLERMIATKMDSSRRIGGILSAVYTAGLTLMGVGTAPTIGAGLRAANPYQIARIILPDDEEEDELGGLSPVIAREDEA
jgi:flagellar biosynthesis protein FlhF